MLAHRLRLLGIDRATQKRAQAHGQPAEQLGLADKRHQACDLQSWGRSAQPALDQLKLKAAASQTPRSHVDSLDAECERLGPLEGHGDLRHSNASPPMHGLQQEDEDETC